MPTINNSVNISAPVESVFAYLSDSRNLPEWFVGVSEVTDESGTKLGFDVDYTIPVPVLGKLAEKAVFKRNQREAQMSTENIKERLEV